MGLLRVIEDVLRFLLLLDLLLLLVGLRRFLLLRLHLGRLIVVMLPRRLLVC